MKHVILIFLIFAFIHSVTVSKEFKHACRRFFGDTFMKVYYRALYNAISFGTAGISLYLIHQAPDRLLWSAPVWLRWPLYIIQLAGVVFGTLSFQHLNTGEFMGMKQVWRYLTRRETAGNIEGLTQKELVTTGVYGIVRHPMYLAGIVIFTFNPHVTVNSLVISVLADLYFLFGMLVEERRFLEIFGDRYREYKVKVPGFLPRIWHRTKG
jgi:methanethiol S-methyltransferase